MTTAVLYFRSFWEYVTIRIDRVWIVIVALLLLLAAFDFTQAQESISFTGEAVFGIVPFLLLAAGLSGYARASGADAQMARVFKGRLPVMILVAALFGGLSPFCSCGVIPIIAALLAVGVPVSAVLAFCLASPLMDPSMFVLTASTLGLEFTIGKTIAAVAIGTAGGFATMALEARGAFANPLRTNEFCGTCGGPSLGPAQRVTWAFWREDERRQIFAETGRTSLLFLFKWLTLAFLIESLMLAWIPTDAFAALFRDSGIWSIPAGVVVGVPAYMNGYAALPLVAGMMDLGMLPGAAMAFTVAGGVTSIPAAMAVFALVRRPVFFWYITMSLLGALAAGILFQAYAG